MTWRHLIASFQVELWTKKKIVYREKIRVDFVLLLAGEDLFTDSKKIEMEVSHGNWTVSNSIAKMGRRMGKFTGQRFLQLKIIALMRWWLFFFFFVVLLTCNSLLNRWLSFWLKYNKPTGKELWCWREFDTFLKSFVRFQLHSFLTFIPTLWNFPHSPSWI